MHSLAYPTSIWLPYADERLGSAARIESTEGHDAEGAGAGAKSLSSQITAAVRGTLKGAECQCLIEYS